jgi:hypothetical protein
MRKYLLATLLILSPALTPAEHLSFESLKRQLNDSKEDTGKAYLLAHLSKYYINIQPDSAFYYARRLVELSRKLQYHTERQ